uniref:Complex 1 LYR protein domain-containing protein n=1 Tax=Vombatus ursinus TaxID=29139 RepID=A0A4X2LV09_VOMUR
MTKVTCQEVLSLYHRIFRLARRWHAASEEMEDTIREKQYIIKEASMLFQKNKNLTDSELIKHHGLQTQEKLRTLSKSLYLKSYNEVS